MAGVDPKMFADSVSAVNMKCQRWPVVTSPGLQCLCLGMRRQSYEDPRVKPKDLWGGVRWGEAEWGLLLLRLEPRASF